MESTLRLLKTTLYISFIISALLIIGCFGPPKQIVHDIKDQTDPYYCLWNLQATYNRHNEIVMIDYYKKILSGDDHNVGDYYFYFDPNDVGDKTPNGYIIPYSWNYEEDWQATQSMFSNAYSIRLEVPTLGQNGDEKDKDDFYNKVSASFNSAQDECTISDLYIDLLVYVNQNQGYQAHGSCNFKFKKSYIDNLWYMIGWYDHTAPQ